MIIKEISKILQKVIIMLLQETRRSRIVDVKVKGRRCRGRRRWYFLQKMNMIG
jgi:hypothetical protein